jgi:hypothetical protein
LHSNIGTVEIPDFVTVIFPDIPTDIDFDIIVIVVIGKNEPASLFQFPVFPENFGDFLVDIGYIRE